MSGAVEQQIDHFILSFAKPEWRKVAMILGKTLDASERSGLDATDQAIADRIEALVEAGKLQSQGNLSMWRHSEVRLPD